ncbi:hypothetical protein WA026_007641 [Henosepilachna vigintioctopunctata]|uniref:SAP domain-containing protein n=1 Tax=Henosepilachna vigintioctopunctata TaxID=420089 RepID=A0AAW1U7I7_9CUCU
MPVVLSTKEVESKIMKYTQKSQQNAQKLLFLPVNSTDSPIQNSSPVNEQTEDQLEYLNMLVTFRVSELQMLLGFAGRNKTGRKTELQQRAHELLRVRSQPIQQKIRDLYKTIHVGNMYM